MARNRTIKVSFWSDAKIGKLKPIERLLFIGLWNFADDCGVISADPVMIRNNVFPYDDFKVKELDDWINNLRNHGFVAEIQHEDEKFLVIMNFSKHQVINRPNERSTNIPKEILDAFKKAYNGPKMVETKAPKEAKRPKREVADNAPSEAYAKFNQWCRENAPEVLKMKYPITESQFNKLREDYDGDTVAEYLKQMSNWQPLLKRCTNANLTLRNWITRDEKRRNSTERTASSTGVRPSSQSVSPDYAASICERLVRGSGND